MHIRNHLHTLTLCALFASLLCVLSPISIPLGPIPVTLGLLGVLLCAVALGPTKAPVSVLVFLALGVCGLPVFGGLQGGASVLFGVTGGFLWGYLPAVGLTGFLAGRRSACSRGRIFLSCFAGTLVCYLCGVLQYMLVARASFWEATVICVLPFVLPDLIKCFLVALVSARLVGLVQKNEKERN